MTKDELITRIQAAYDQAQSTGNPDAMLGATRQMLEVWLQETARYAQQLATAAPALIIGPAAGKFTAPNPSPANCLCGASTSELHSGDHDLNGDGAA